MEQWKFPPMALIIKFLPIKFIQAQKTIPQDPQ